MFLKWWLQENELTIAGYQEIERLLIAVTSGKSFTNQQSEVVCQRRFGIIDRLVLANHPAQHARQVPCPRFQRRVTQNFVRLHRPHGTRNSAQEKQDDKNATPQ